MHLKPLGLQLTPCGGERLVRGLRRCLAVGKLQARRRRLACDGRSVRIELQSRSREL